MENKINYKITKDYFWYDNNTFKKVFVKINEIIALEMDPDMGNEIWIYTKYDENRIGDLLIFNSKEEANIVYDGLIKNILN